MTGVAALEARLKTLEDRQEITQLLAMHPLAIDSGDGDFWMSNCTKDLAMDRTLDPEAHSGHYEGVYSWDTMLTEIKGPELAASRKAGLMHFDTPPSIKLDGDKGWRRTTPNSSWPRAKDCASSSSWRTEGSSSVRTAGGMIGSGRCARCLMKKNCFR